MRFLDFKTTYIGLLIASAAMTIISFFTGKLIDIHLYDTMFVISTFHVFGLFFLLVSVLYLANRRLVKINGKANIFLWIVLIVTWLMWAITMFSYLQETKPPANVDAYISWAVYRNWLNKSASFIILFFLLFQLLFWLYFIVRVTSKLLKKKSQTSI